MIEACDTLPSSEAACELVTRPTWKAAGKVAGTMLMRAALVAAGMAIAGERAHLVRNTLAATLAIEAFVLTWSAVQARRAAK